MSPIAPSTVHIRLLGDFRVMVGQRDLGQEAWRLRKAAGLIKLLALAPGNRLHKDQLLEALWPDMAPDAAYNNLRRTLHAARRALEPEQRGSSYLLWQGEQLQLSSAGGVVVDVVQFEQAAALARRSGSLAAYRVALDLYGGELLPEDPYEDWAIARRESVQRLRLSLLLEVARLHEREQNREQAIAAYQRIVAFDALHEEARAALMRLYALGGQRGQALHQYKQLASALQEELGVAPDPATQRLHDEIRAGRFPDPAQLAVAAARQPRNNLPHALTSFVGREAEMALVKQLLQENRLLTLSGPGGSGKTRLALEVARTLVEQFADGVWLVELAPLSDATLVAETVLKAMELKEQAGRPASQVLAQSMRSRHLLLILDNCEHLSEAVAHLAHHLLRNAPRLTILTTSRQSLEVLGEAIWVVPPLSLPGDTWSLGDPGSPHDLLAFEAIRLFVERARLAHAGFTLTPSNRVMVVQLCRRLDGLPLAIELAAAALKSLSLDQVTAGLDDRFSLLIRGNRTALPRQQTLRAVMDWSYGLLDEAEQKLFRRMALFSGGASLEAIESVCNRLGDLPFGMRAGVTALLDKHLVRREQGPDGEPRITMLETVQAYAREQLASSGEWKDVARDHAQTYLGLAETARDELNGPRQAIWLAQLDADHDNLRGALHWAEVHGDAEAGLRLAAALWRFWLTRSYFGEGREWCARVLALAQGAGDSPLGATVLKGAGALSYRQGDYAEAQALFEKALAAARRSGDQQNVADLLNNLGLIAQALGRYAEARALYEESLTMTRALGDLVGVARTRNNQGLAAIFQGDYDAARSLLAEALTLARQVGNRSSEDNALNNLGVLAIHEEAYEEASALNEERLALARQLGNKYGIASALHNLGLVADRLGDAGAAQSLFEESLAIAGEIGDKGITTAALQNLGVMKARRKEYDAARRLYHRSLAMAWEIGDRYLAARALEEAAALAAVQGAAIKAAQLGGAAEALREAIRAPRPPAERAAYEQAMAKAQLALEGKGWAATWAQGRAMSMEEALATLAEARVEK